MMTGKTKGFVYGIVAAATYGMNPLFALPLYKAGMDVASVLFYRYAIALAVLALVIKAQKVDFRVRRRDLPALAGLGLLFSMSSLFLFTSYNYMDAGVASTILFVYPVMVAVIMSLFFKERVSLLTTACIVMSLAGISLLSHGGDGALLSGVGIALVLLSALSYAVYMVGLNRSSVRGMPAAKLTFYGLLFGLPVFIVRTGFLTELRAVASGWLWVDVLLLATLPTVVSLVMTAVAIRRIGSTAAAILGALEPVTALFFGVLVFGERLTPRICAGVLLILAAVTLIIAGKPFLTEARTLLRRFVR